MEQHNAVIDMRIRNEKRINDETNIELMKVFELHLQVLDG